MSGARQAPHYTDRLHPCALMLRERHGSNLITADVKASMGAVALLLLLRLHGPDDWRIDLRRSNRPYGPRLKEGRLVSFPLEEWR
jgi:hypothetical protein